MSSRGVPPTAGGRGDLLVLQHSTDVCEIPALALLARGDTFAGVSLQAHVSYGTRGGSGHESGGHERYANIIGPYEPAWAGKKP